jgi:hypothetical protein
MAQWGDQSREPCQKLHGLHHSVSVFPPGFADGVSNASVEEHAQAFQAKRRPGAIAQEPLSALAVAR